MNDAGSTIESVVRELDARRLAAALSGDVALMGELLHPELVYTHTFGERDDYDSMIEKLESKVFDYRSIAHHEDRIIVLGDTAIVVGSQRAEIVVAGALRRVHNATLAVWTVDDGSWRMVAFQATAVPSR